MDGNYSRLLPKRLARATGLILLDASTAASLTRYIRRTVHPRNRVGGLDGTHDKLRLRMFRYIIGHTRSRSGHYATVFHDAPCPKVLLPNRRAINEFSRRHDLQLR